MKAILIPGANPDAAKKLFATIKAKIPELEYIELPSASEDKLYKARPAGDFLLIGKSMGGKVALEYEYKEKDSKGLILLSPAVSFLDKYSVIAARTLIVHGTSDEVIPFDNSERLAKVIKDSKLVKIESGDHSYRGKEEDVAKAIRDWLLSEGFI
jgi:pimeloyl-ACP methyl ester carboxylesterase